jgi:nicotinate-nucleotide--dimethylbenzimidazole phosphoribosyltransferase
LNQRTDIAGAVTQRWNSLTKPPGSLGRLESLVRDYAVIHGSPQPPLRGKAIAIFCSDHGVVEENVTAYPGEVTAQMVRNFLRGGAAISVLCRCGGIEPVIVDAGVNADPEPGVIDRKIARGTRNFAREPAMTRAQAQLAIDHGAALAAELKSRADIAGIGEMGIGNTASASALLCAFAGIPPEQAAGPGAGLSSEGVRHKAQVIARAIALHRPDPRDPVGTLAAIGGFEIAMMTGFLLGASSHRLPVVIDGFICCSAVLAAKALDPQVGSCLIFSHVSAEPAHRRMLEYLGARPLLDLEMRLGEGTGAALVIGLLANALALYNGMATFGEAQVTSTDPVARVPD